MLTNIGSNFHVCLISNFLLFFRYNQIIFKFQTNRFLIVISLGGAVGSSALVRSAVDPGKNPGPGENFSVNLLILLVFSFLILTPYKL